MLWISSPVEMEIGERIFVWTKGLYNRLFVSLFTTSIELIPTFTLLVMY